MNILTKEKGMYDLDDAAETITAEVLRSHFYIQLECGTDVALLADILNVYKYFVAHIDGDTCIEDMELEMIAKYGELL
jgi:hypothetical protein